jgi:predicted permease
MAMLAVPKAWRADVYRDLVEEATDGSVGVAGTWICRQALAIGIALRLKGARETFGLPRLPPLGASIATGLRRLRHDHTSTVAIIAVLAVGIASVTTAQAVFNVALFRPVPGIAAPSELVTIFYQPDHIKPNRTAAGASQLRALRDHVPAMSGVVSAGSVELPVSLAPNAPPRAMNVWWTTRGYFQVLGVRAKRGRLFTAEEYESSTAPVVVISERLRRREFPDNGEVVGRDVYVNRQRFTVVGVTDRFVGSDLRGRADMWLPAGAYRAFSQDTVDWFPAQEMIGRLRPGATAADAQVEATRASANVGAVKIGDRLFMPQVYEGPTDGVGLTGSRLLAIYQVLMGGVGLLLVLACANASNLMVARNVRRARDLSLRAALGASRWRLLSELITEAALLAVGAAAFGLLAASLAVRLFSQVRLLSYLPPLGDISIDIRVAAFAVGAAALVTVAFGALPAWVGSKANPQDALRTASSRMSSSGRLRASFVALQLALSITLIVGAGVLTQTVRNLRHVDLGMTIDRVFTFYVRPSTIGYDDRRTGRLVSEVMARLREQPGIDGVAAKWFGPLDSIEKEAVRSSAKAEAITVDTARVSADYFDVMNVPLLRGRTFNQAEERIDQTSDARAVLINEEASRLLFGDAPALGQVLVGERGPKPMALTVVGVVGNTRSSKIREPFGPMVFQPIGVAPRIATIIARTRLSPSDTDSLARSVLQSVEPALAAGEPGMLTTVIDNTLAEERLLARLGVVISLVAGVLAIGGLYAVMSCFVAERTREFGIRLALGAAGSDISRLVVRNVLALAVAGTALAALAIWCASGLLASRTYGVSPTDGVTVVASITGVVALALGIAWLPARRATGTDPAITLRSE